MRERREARQNEALKRFIRNWYEGGFPISSPGQSYLPSIVQDARFDQNFVTRREMMRRMRYWSQNSPFVKRALDVSRQYVIGTHVPKVTSLATDPSGDWKKNAEQVFHEMCQEAGFNGEPLLDMMNVAHDCKKVDGDILFIPTSRMGALQMGKRTIQVPRPCLQMVEGHRIETPFSRWNEEGRTIIDGVQFRLVDQLLPGGRRQTQLQRAGYHVKNSISAFTNEDSWAFVPADKCHLVYSPSRVAQIRGISDFYAVEQTIHKLEDMLLLEMRAQQSQSERAVGIENASGQFSPLDPKIQAVNNLMGKKDDPEKFKLFEKMVEYYRKTVGGLVYAFKFGEKVHFDAPNRPSDSTRALWEFLINSFCVGSKMPRTLLFPKTDKGQGTEVRAELDAADTAFNSEFHANWKPFIHFVWEYFMGWAIYNDLRVVDPPADWRQIHVPRPRSILVDAGYESAAMLAEYAAGVTNLDEIAAKRGTTSEALIQHSVRNLARLKQVCAEVSEELGIQIKPEEVRESLVAVLKSMQPQKEEKEPEEVNA